MVGCEKIKHDRSSFDYTTPVLFNALRKTTFDSQSASKISTSTAWSGKDATG